MHQYYFEQYHQAILQRIASLKKGLGISTTATTTLIVGTPVDVRHLEARYKLIRYELPKKLYWLADKNHHTYGQMHNSLRDQLDYPYKTFKYDQLDGTKKWVVYALYPRHVDPVTLQLAFLSDEPLPTSEIALDQLDLQLLLQLLQIAYCHNEQSGRFVGQDQCYVYAKKDNNDTHLCLQIDIQADSCMQAEEDEQEFTVVAQPRYLRQVISPQMHPYSSPYFVRKEHRSRSIFCQLKKAEIEAYGCHTEPLYKMYTDEEQHATLLSQDQAYIEGCMGKLLYDFIRDFSMHLASNGFIIRSGERHFSRFTPSNQHQLQLPLSLLNPQEWLPLMPEGFVFIRKKRYDAGRSANETLLYVENDALHFLDLRDPDQLVLRDDLFARLGVNWQAMYDQMRRKCHMGESDGEPALSRYDVIVGPDLFITLENLNERVLYNYDEIIRGQTSMNIALPIEEFKLLPHYDIVCTTDCLPRSALIHRGLLESHACRKNRREEVSLKFYRQLEKYDAFLNDVQHYHSTISFDNLTQGQHWEEITHIFNMKPDINSQYAYDQFKGYYQKRGWFTNNKEKVLSMYEGIWYDDTHCYIVGMEQPPDQQQPYAHRIKRFQVYQGADHFDMSPLLLTVGVQAINLKQDGADPYPFHLIDLHVERRLQLQGREC